MVVLFTYQAVQKVNILKKTTVQCPSRCNYSTVWIFCSLTGMVSSARLAVQKVHILKKTTVLCPSRSYYWLFCLLTRMASSARLAAQKVPILKKTTVLWPSRRYYSTVWLSCSLTSMASSTRLAVLTTVPTKVSKRSAHVKEDDSDLVL